MATKDVLTKEYMQLKDVFADVFNFFLFDGKPVIQPQQLREKTTEIFETRRSSAVKGRVSSHFRDLLCLLSMDDAAHSYLLLGIEDQTQAQHALPIRSLLYDALQYRDQIKLITKQRRIEQQQAQTATEILSGFQKDDHLHPVVTLVIYLGTEPWAGPRSIHEMFDDLPSDLLTHIPNYQLHLIEPAALSDEDLGKFQSNLREVLTVIKYSKDKDRLETVMQDPRFRAVQYEAASLLNELAGLKLDLTTPEEGGTINMFIGFEQLKEDYKRQGKLESLLISVKSLMTNLNLDIEAAMKALNISEDQQEVIRTEITPNTSINTNTAADANV